MNYHNVEKRKISKGDLWAMDANHIEFIVGATYESTQLRRASVSGWVKTEAASCVWVLVH